LFNVARGIAVGLNDRQQSSLKGLHKIMAQSFCQIYIHAIFSTKDREPWLDDNIRKRVHAYLSTIIRDMDCPYVVVGGIEDHVHIIMDIGKKHLPIDILAKAKKESSKFGMFSVSPGNVFKIEKYILNQKDHHKKQTFKDELLAFLKKYNIKYDEKYLWD